MAKVSNLRSFRKRKARATAESKAAENRIRFGRTPQQRKNDEAAQVRGEKRLAQLRREPEADED